MITAKEQPNPLQAAKEIDKEKEKEKETQPEKQEKQEQEQEEANVQLTTHTEGCVGSRECARHSSARDEH